MTENKLSKSEFMRKNKIISLTADIFIYDDKYNFILIKRSAGEYKDYWALPGGFVEYGETVENAAIREAKEETNINIELKDLVNVYSNPDRDSRGHIVTVAYTAKGNFNTKKADSDAKDIGVFSQDKIKNMKIAFDHEKIINDCLNKIREK